MSWSWSHSNEAYGNARQNMRNKDRKWLSTVFAEWEGRDGDDFDQKKCAAAELKAASLPDDVLADHIWERMEAQALCSDGGHEAWCCPFGCDSHMVPFELEAQAIPVNDHDAIRS